MIAALWKDHPVALRTLFFTEMWERFSFYGMQGILLIYLYYSVNEGGLGMDEATASGLVGAYGGLVYLSTILGAWLGGFVANDVLAALFFGAAAGDEESALAASG